MAGRLTRMAESGPGPATLRRELRIWDTVALSVGVMAPTLAMSVTGAAAAQRLGRAACLGFVVAALGVGLVAYGFVRLAGEFSHAGSVYAFVGRSIGPRAGFVAGWTLLGTYLVFPPVSILGVAVFGRAFLRTSGLSADADWFPIALLAWAVVWFLAARGIRPTMRSMIVFELASLALILVLVAAIWIRLITGSAPGGARPSSEVFVLPPGTGFTSIALAATAGFLAFAGFESAGSLGEESLTPRRDIPRAVVVAVAFGAVFYVACMITQSLGFGVDEAGASAFAHSDAPLGELATRYLGSALAAALDLGAVLSAIGAGVGGVTVAARMMFAFARDNRALRPLAQVSARTGGPRRAVTVEMVIGLVLLTAFRFAGTTALNAFYYLATIGVLGLLVMYVMTNAAAARLLARGSPRDVVLPLIGVLVAGYVLYHNLWPVPEWPYRLLPYLELGWLTAGVVVVVATRDHPGWVRAD